ncbi:MAG: UbiA family prenyltransferase [Candidatus Moranbacteria bacterium]|nr:UbiA family prenyltransferase [Candidatus Moranbacteria bacterium]
MIRLKKIKEKIEKIESQPIKFEIWLILFIAIILIRIFEEVILNIRDVQTDNFIFHDLIHILVVFAFVNLLAYFIFKKTLNLNSRAFLNISIFGTFFLSIIPPFLDFLFSLNNKMINFYEFYSLKECLINFFTFLQQDPFIGTTPGQRIVIFLSMIVAGLYTFIKSKKIAISFLNFFLFYILFYFVSTLPSLITFFIKGWDSTASDVAALFFAPTDFLNQPTFSINIVLHKKMIFTYVILLTFTSFIIFIKNKIFREIIKNIRPIQTIYHLGLFSIGLGLAVIFGEASLNLNFLNNLALIVMILNIVVMWFSSVIINDYFDENIDEISNQNRPLVKKIIEKNDYLKIGVVLFLMAIILSALINFSITILLCIYYALTLAYNIPPLRLKKIPLVATFISALASMVIIFTGYLMIIPENNLQNFPLIIIYLLLITFTISLPIKDFKDIVGDKKNGVLTIPVIFGEKMARLIIGINIFISFMLSVYFLNEMSLFLPTLIFGFLSFLVINFNKDSEHLFGNKKIVPVIFSLVFIYGIILAWIVFL